MTLWIILGVVGYLLIGGFVASVGNEGDLDEVDVAGVTLIWPLLVVLVVVVGLVSAPYHLFRYFRRSKI